MAGNFFNSSATTSVSVRILLYGISYNKTYTFPVLKQHVMKTYGGMKLKLHAFLTLVLKMTRIQSRFEHPGEEKVNALPEIEAR
jgi:hypothetical protein